jgi:magnesium chelatase family protein
LYTIFKNNRPLERIYNSHLETKVAVITHCSTILGVDALGVDVETQITGALRRFTLVGLPDSALREAKERVRCAIESSGFQFPQFELIVSLAPAAVPKTGSGFDLAIAVGILSASGQIDKPLSESYYFLGELSLSGEVRAVAAAIATSQMICSRGGGVLFVAKEIAAQASCIEGVRVVGVQSLSELVAMLGGKREMDFEPLCAVPPQEPGDVLDFGDVIGQESAKRALEISAAGGHNMLMIGPPGVGKSMLARRVMSILPPPSLTEMLETTKIHNAAQYCSFRKVENNLSLKATRPFRSPHHSSSTVSLIGGGARATPGELSLAHRGVLFLDELPEMKRDALESLREPLETREVNICRASYRISFPANFLLIAAMNPCPRGSCPRFETEKKASNKTCRCTGSELARYRSRLSGPLMDRFDLQVWVPRVPIDALDRPLRENPTCIMRENVRRVREIQTKRFAKANSLNAQMTTSEIKQYCAADSSASAFLREASSRYELSARGYHRVLKLARTIADLDSKGSDSPAELEEGHIAEAISYRMSLEQFASF